MTYVKRSSVKALQASDRADVLKDNIQAVKEVYMSYMDSFDPTLNNAYSDITVGSICGYANTMQMAGNIKAMYLPIDQCSLMNYGWGTEVRFDC